MSVCNLNGFAQTVVVTNPTSPWTVPAGVTSIKVEVWGGGGAGGGCNSTLFASYGSGGGGGAYNVSTFAVSSGQTYTISRGAGGTGSSDADGTNGTVSSVSGPGGSVSANPGSGGARRGGKNGTGGSGGFNNGGKGGSATSNGAGGGGGAGNAPPAGTGNGGDGSNTAAGSAGAGALHGGAGGAYRNNNGTGNAGAAPGGGGGGGYQSLWNGSKAGGAGASGQVVITYTTVTGTTITGFTPGSACSGSGQSVSITGTNFTAATAVTFYSGQSALFTVTSATQITATLPAGATTGPISVTTPSGTGTSSGSFTVNTLPAAPTAGTITQPTCATSTGSVVLNSLPAVGNWTLTRSPGGTTNTGTGTSTTITGLPSGQYTFTVTNASGCISPASANIAINTQQVTPIIPNQTASISSGSTFTVTPGGGTNPVGTTYTWTAPTYTGGVTGGSAQAVPQINISGTLTIPSGSGTATYIVKPTSGICVGATFTVTVTVTSSCVQVTIGTQPGDNIMCATSGNASFTVVAGGAAPFTYQWQYHNGNTWATVINGTPSGALYTNEITSTLSVTGITTAGSFQYRCYITNCSGGNNAISSATNLTVNALPIPTLTSSDADNVFCFGTSVTFTAGGGTGYNFRVGGVSVQNGASATYTTSSLTNGQVVDVIVTNANGCIATSAGITNSVYVTPIANAGTGGNNCGLVFHLNGSLNIGTGTWAKVSGPGNVTFSPDANTANATVTVTSYGSYTFSWTVINGACSNSANVTIAFIQQPAANAGSGGDVCTNNFIFNALVTTGTGTWTKVTGPGNAVFTPDVHKANAKVTVDKFGAYDFAWTVVNSTCTSIGGVRLVFHDLPSINAGKDSTICKGGSIQLQALGSGSVSWVPAALVSNPNIINPIATPDTTTTFTINLTDQYGCKNSDNIVIGVRERIIADAGPDQALGYVFTTTMDAKLAHSYERGIWKIISGTGKFLDSTYARTTVSSLSIGPNEFLWTVTNGFCPPSYDTTLVEVNNFVIPTLITPNMDGRNDYFVIRGLETVGKTELVIFDRRGVQLYKNMNYDNSWNGVDYNKNPLPDDTYFYVLKSENGKSYSGYIVIRR